MCTIQRNILDARRWLCLFLVCAFVLCGIGGIHQRAHAIVGVDDALIGILIAGLAAVGITFVSTGAYNTLTEYVGSLLDQYAGSIGTTGQGLFTGVQTGANSTGQLLINNRFVRLISAFATWIRLEFGLIDNSNTMLQQAGTTINSLIVYELPIMIATGSSNPGGTFEYIILESEDSVYAAWHYYGSSGGCTLTLFSDGPAKVQRNRIQTSGSVLHATVTLQAPSGDYDYYHNLGYTTTIPEQKVINEGFTVYTQQQVTDALTSDKTIQQSGVTIDVNTGVINPPLDDTDYEDGDGAIIDVAAPWGMTYPDIVNKWIPKEWAPGMSGNPSMTYDAAPAIDEQVQTGPETAQVSSDPGEYAVPGLQSVFPFCIPFDIYNLLSALAADPVAPSFTWRFYVPGICDENITVDLSPFDTVAQIVRTVELLAFIVGLAMVTRERFLRG